MRFMFILLILAMAPTAVRAANAPTPESAANESLGTQLLDDLQPSTKLQSPPKSSSQKPAEQNRKSPAQSPTPAAQFDDLGEDIGQLSGPLPLVRARQGMQRATSLIATSSKLSDSRALQQAGTVQKQVVAQLDELIAELSKQCQGGQCQPSDKPQQQSQRSQPKPGQTVKGEGRGKSAARDSTDTLNRPSAQPVDKGDNIDALVKDLWGHLPERSREQMLQSFSTEFLPKYELEIEQYYRRLSEESGNATTER